ncbi:MAG: hypothetical protein RLZZ546_747 [Bacteroidota bacterium]|jgi:hypothetical protein
MDSIIIHTETKEQTKAFEQMAKAMDLEYSKENKMSESRFFKEFKEAHKKGYTVEQARKKSLQLVEKLWKEK